MGDLLNIGGLVEHWNMKKNQKNPEENLREIIKALAPDFSEGEMDEALRNFTRYIAVAEEVARKERFKKKEDASK